MRVFSERHRLLIALGLVLVAGFATVVALNYFDTRDNLRKGVSEQSLPLTGDAIHAEIRSDVLRPVLIGATIAQDVFLRDWLINGEIGTDQIARYLKEMSAKHGATVFLASEKTRQYYAADNTVKPIEQSNAQHGWFFHAREMKDPYQISVALDSANRDQTAVTVHHRILDQTGALLGVVGITMPANTMVQATDQYQARLDRSVYFANAQGALVLAAKSAKPAAATLQDHPGMREIAARLLNGSSKPMQFEYRLNGATILVNSRFIPELGWYLIVEENTARQLQPVRQTLMLSLAIGGATILLALVIVLLFVNRDQKRMERMASIDPLTGLLNRQAFEIVLEQSMLDVKRSGQPISAILFDIDSFQQVNDKHGHSTGDQILRTIAQLARRVVRDNDIITRWSGTEFLILLRECPLDIAVGVAEKLRNAISSQNFGLSSPPQTITTSLGVAQFSFQESQIGFFIRVDKALRDAKTSGRNRTIASVMENQDENIAATLARRG